MDADEEFARALQAKMDAEMRAKCALGMLCRACCVVHAALG